MNAASPIHVMAIYVCVLCALYLQYKGLSSLVAAVISARSEPSSTEERSLVAGSIGYLCMSVFFAVMGVGEILRIAP